MHYKYDLEIIIPVSFKVEKYLFRFKNFCQYCIVNCNQSKILINFLIGTEQIPEEVEKYFSFFPENVCVNKFTSNVDHPAAKVYDFYSRYENYGQSKWIVRLDDDSITNIDLLVNYLSSFNCEKEYYLTPTDKTVGNVRTTIELLKKYNLYDELYGDFNHEIELAIISNKAFKQIIQEHKQIIQERSQIQDGYTDQLFCLLSKLCGILPYPSPLLSAHSKLHEFLTNKLLHIHFIYKKINIIDIIDNKSIKIPFNNEFLLCELNSENIILNSYLFKLNSNKIVHHVNAKFFKNLAFWNYIDNKLIFYDANTNISFVYDNFSPNSDNIIKDFNSNIIFKLRSV